MNRDILTLALIALAVTVLAACGAVPEPRIVIKEVAMPYHVPCPAEKDVPGQPARVAAEHPTMPVLADGSTDWQAVSRILGAKVLEWITYGERADGVMRACGGSATSR